MIFMILMENESELFKIKKYRKISYFYLIFPWILFCPATLVLFVPYLIIAAYFLLRWHNEEIIVTNQRFINKSGAFSISTQSLPLSKIDNIILEQSLLGRKFNYGKLVIRTGSFFSANVQNYILNPDEVLNSLNQAIENAKK